LFAPVETGSLPLPVLTSTVHCLLSEPRAVASGLFAPVETGSLPLPVLTSTVHCLLSGLWILQHSNKWQVAITLGKVQTVANHKMIGNPEAKIVDLHFSLTALILVE